MEIGWSALWFIVAISLLVTIHEFGHFWVARKLGFKVLRFSVGFGKPLYKRVGPAPDYTEFVIAALPLGGYVRMLDERDGAVAPEDLPRAFTRRPPWQRILVLLAGPAANILFAVLVLWVIFWVNGVNHLKAVVDRIVVGSPAAAAGLANGDEIRSIDGEPVLDQVDATLGLLDAVSDDGEAVMTVRNRIGAERTVTLTISDPVLRHKLTEPYQLYLGLGFEYWSPPFPAVLGEVEAGGPADKAGLMVGDEIKVMDGAPVRNFIEFRDYVRARPGQEIVVVVRRGGSDLTRRVTVASAIEGEQDRRAPAHQPAGRRAFPIHPRCARTPPVGPLSALSYSVAKAWQMTAAQAKLFGRMFTGDVSWKNPSGVIGIASAVGDAAHAGIFTFLMLMVLLSLSLGFLNLLPIPILDGGQIVFQLARVGERAPAVRPHLPGRAAGRAAAAGAAHGRGAVQRPVQLELLRTNFPGD